MYNFNFYKKYIFIGFILTFLSIPLFYGLWLLSSKKQPEITYDIKILPTDHVFGNTQSKNILIEYSDFQCPACAYYSNILRLFKSKYASTAAVVYRHFPLPQHPNSTRAARAAESAGKQGKFWEMHDLLFSKQNEWGAIVDSDKKFEEYAKQLNLDMDKFKKDYSSQEVSKKIGDDFISGNSYNVDATPTFFLNGKKLKNIKNLEDIEKEMIR